MSASFRDIILSDVRTAAGANLGVRAVCSWLAERLNCSDALVGHWLTGARSPTADRLVALADVLEWSPARLGEATRLASTDPQAEPAVGA